MSLSSSQIESLLGTRYVAGASVTLMLYEHWLNLDKEINLVWQAKKWSFLPTFVLVDIYMREIGILFMAIGSLLLPIQHTSTHCPPVTSGYTDLSTEIADYGFSSLVYTLWDKQKLVAYTMLVGFATCFLATVALSVLAGIHELGGVRYIEKANACSFQHRTYFAVGVWAPMVLFDFCVLIILLIRSLGNPRRQDSQLAVLLYRDGFVMFLGFFVRQAEQVLVWPLLTWALDGVLSRRLLLRVKHIEANTGHVYLWQPTDTETQPRAGSLSLMSSVQVWEEVEMKLL
ncbi:hypothetical protein C8Q72DRAFT_798877 [Fomitopsis betulina]|nr:hypothetical protein C8Q72DRAFT_798877 [Fomitopsis betulina]